MIFYRIKSPKYTARRFEADNWEDFGASRSVEKGLTVYRIMCVSGLRPIRDGDWRVESESGNVWIDSDEVFRGTYEPVRRHER